MGKKHTILVVDDDDMNLQMAEFILKKEMDVDVVLAGGAENMSATAYAIPSGRWGARMFDNKIVDMMVNDGLMDVFNGYHMGITAENVADEFGVTREDMDNFAAASQQKACAAIASGRFKDEIVPVEVP